MSVTPLNQNFHFLHVEDLNSVLTLFLQTDRSCILLLVHELKQQQQHKYHQLCSGCQVLCCIIPTEAEQITNEFTLSLKACPHYAKMEVLGSTSSPGQPEFETMRLAVSTHFN